MVCRIRRQWVSGHRRFVHIMYCLTLWHECMKNNSFVGLLYTITASVSNALCVCSAQQDPTRWLSDDRHCRSTRLSPVCAHQPFASERVRPRQPPRAHHRRAQGPRALPAHHHRGDHVLRGTDHDARAQVHGRVGHAGL